MKADEAPDTSEQLKEFQACHLDALEATKTQVPAVGRAEMVDAVMSLYNAGLRMRDALTRQLQEQAEEIERLRRANRTRPDYDLTCSECGKAHILDTSLPSEIWNQIAQPEDILCTLCIDERLAAKGLSCFAEFYFVGAALTSKLYSQDLQEVRKQSALTERSKR